METSEMEKKCMQLLDLEDWIRRLHAYRPGKILTAKEVTDGWRMLLKHVGLSILGILLLLKLIIPFVKGLQLEGMAWLLKMAVVAVLYFGVLFLGAFAVGSLIGALATIKGLIKELRSLFTLKKRNERVKQNNEQVIADLQKAEKDHEALVQELMDASVNIEHDTDEAGHILANFFFELPFNPEHTAKNLLYANKNGETFEKQGVEWFCGCYGKIQFTKDSQDKPRLNGLGGGIPCTANLLRELVQLPTLYMDVELLDEATQPSAPEKPLLYVIREVHYTKLTTRYSETTVTTYNVEGALKQYNDDWNHRELLIDLAGGRTSDAAYLEHQAGEAMLNSLPTSSSSTTSSDYLTGEQLEMLDKAYIVRYKGKLICACLPRDKMQKVSLIYKLDNRIYRDPFSPGYFEKTIPEDVRFHGKVTGLDVDKCIPDNYSTIAYITEYLSKYMLPQDLLEPQPEGVSGTEWRLWMAMRHQYRSKNYTRSS